MRLLVIFWFLLIVLLPSIVAAETLMLGVLPLHVKSKTVDLSQPLADKVLAETQCARVVDKVPEGYVGAVFVRGGGIEQMAREGMVSESPSTIDARLHSFTVPADYLRVGSTVSESRVPPFDAPYSVTWADIWRENRYWVLGLSMTLVGLFYISGRLAVANRRLRETRKKTLESTRKLADSEERYHLAMQGSHDGLWDWNIQANSLYLSPRFKEILGYGEDELEPPIEALASRLHPDDKDSIWAAVEDHLSKQATYDLEYRMLHKSGEYIWVKVRGAAVHDKQGIPVRMIGSITDITDQKSAAIKLQEMTERYRSLFINSPDAYLIMEIDEGAIIDCNVAAERMLRGERSQILGKRPYELSPDRQPDGQWSREAAKQRIHESLCQEYQRFEWMLKRLDGSDFWVDVSLSVILYDGRKVLFVTWREIGDRKQIESEIRRREQYQRVLLDNFPFFVWLKDRESRLLAANLEYARVAHVATTAELEGKTDLDLFAHDLAEVQIASDREVMESNRSICIEEEYPHETGESHWYETWKAPVVIDDKVVGTVGFCRDITERKRVEEQLRIAAVAYKAHEGIVITDENQTILRVNPAFTEITGYSYREAVGQSLEFLKSGIQNDSFYKAMWEQIVREGRWQGQLWNRRKNGDVYPVWLSIAAVKNDAGGITHYVAMMLDNSARLAAEKKIEHLAFYDPLTELPNRRFFLDRLNETLISSSNTRQFGALLLVDLDNFKLLNNTAGHEAGDQLLIETAQRMRQTIREGDLVARFEGDEYAVMLNDLGDVLPDAAGRARAIGEKIQQALQKSYVDQNVPYHISASIGITLFGMDDRSIGDLLNQADIAMHQAKSSGRGSLRFFNPEMQLAVSERVDLENALHHAFESNQFVLHFQPQVNENIGIYGAEVLLRWQHPKRGLIMPSNFISVAEETGVINEIGRWVIESVCTQLVSWKATQTDNLIRLSVNVSPRQFRQADFVDQVRQTLEDTGASATHLALELTENVVLEDIEDSVAKMRELKALGVAISLDDFGTGYSSLSYLSRLPIDELKIDRSFVLDLPGNSNDAVVVQTIISLAKSLGLEILAEGVENQDQRDFLQRQGCPNYQGYLVARPLPLAEFEQMCVSFV